MPASCYFQTVREGDRGDSMFLAIENEESQYPFAACLPCRMSPRANETEKTQKKDEESVEMECEIQTNIFGV